MECPYCGPDCKVGYGYCHCGCGDKTTIATRTSNKHNERRGQPYAYLNGHASRKLSDKQVAEIRRRYLEESITQRELAEEYGVTRTLMNRLLRMHSRRRAGVEEERSSTCYEKSESSLPVSVDGEEASLAL